MKKLTALALSLALTLSLAACGGGTTTQESGAPAGSAAPEETTPAGSGETVTASGAISIDAIAVDDSWRDDEESPLRMVYLFYTVTAADTNLEADSVYTEMTINGSNTYESENYPGTCDYLSSYYYSSYIEDVFMGTSLKVACTFQIPEADLAAGRSITFTDHNYPEMDDLSMSTDDIQHFDGVEAMAEAIDPEGYQAELEKRAEADPERTEMVKNQINGYYWTCYVNSTTYELEFWADNNFEVRTSLGTSNSGTYSVRNGYIFCTYPDTGFTVEVPYEITDEGFDLDIIAAFDVN